MTTEILSLTEINEADGGKDVLHDTALRQIEAKLVRALSRTTTAEPGSPAAGDVYIIPTSATGTNWSGQDGKIGHYYNSSWKFYAGLEGLRLWVNDEDQRVVYDGGAWVDLRRKSKSVAGGSDVNLTAAEASHEVLEFTGALTANINVIVPTRAKTWSIYNNTSGSYTLKVKTTAGTGVIVQQGKRTILYCDGTNVVRLVPDSINSVIDGQLTHDMASDADYTLSASTDPQEWQYETVKITDTGVVLTVGRNIVVPTNTKKYLFINATAQTLTLKTSAGSGVAVAASKNAICWCDGTNVVRMSQDS